MTIPSRVKIYLARHMTSTAYRLARLSFHFIIDIAINFFLLLIFGL